ncbi:MAG: VWA domain-containing protein [Ignisphaera sp.]|uniref:VWA domain-containing protein n=1 Tax=Ignisphaera aggregans TaxID=334771 RepID=A0A7J3MYV5_9CREN
MSIAVEPKLAKIFIVEDKIETIPFIVRVKGVGSSQDTRSLYAVAIDASWSMDGAKIFRAKEATIQMLKNLSSEDLVNIYSFNNKVERIAYMAKVSNYETIADSVASIKLGGGTNIYGLLKQIYRDYIEMKNSNGKVDSFKLVMVTDGVPTTGVKDETKIAEMAKKLGENVSISLIIGVGSDYNEKLLMNIATSTRGFFEHLSNPSKIPSMFNNIASRYRGLCVKNVKLFVRSLPGASIYIYNRPAYAVRGGIEVDVGDVYSNETIDIVGEVVLPPQKKGLIHIASISASYTDTKEVSREISPLPLSLPCLSKPSIEYLDIDEKLFKEFNMVKMASLLAKDLYGKSSIVDIKKIIEELANATLTVDRRDLYSRTIDIRAQLEQEGFSPEVVKKLISLVSRIVSGRFE